MPPEGLGELVTNGEPISTDFRTRRRRAVEGRALSTPVSPREVGERSRRGGKRSKYWRVELPYTEVRAAEKTWRYLLQPPFWANAEDRRARKEALEMLRMFIRGCLEEPKDRRRIGGFVGYRRGMSIRLVVAREPPARGGGSPPPSPPSNELPPGPSE